MSATPWRTECCSADANKTLQRPFAMPGLPLLHVRRQVTFTSITALFDGVFEAVSDPHSRHQFEVLTAVQCFP